MTLVPVSFPVSEAVQVSLDKGDRRSEPSSSFATWLNRELADVNNRIVESDLALTKLATGESGNLHQVMIALESARVSFQLAVQIRNKILEGYHEIMRMQV